MSIETGFTDLSELYRLSFKTPLSLVLAQILEVYPASPSEGGSRQQIRVGTPGRGAIDVQMFDQGASIPMAMERGYVRFSASPNAMKAIVWEQSKAVKPSMNVGVVVVRKQARVELFRPDQAAAAGIGALGFMVASASRAEPAMLQSTVAPAFASAPAPATPLIGTTPSENATELARSYMSCLAAARQARNADDSEEDVRYAARVLFDHLHRSKVAA